MTEASQAAKAHRPPAAAKAHRPPAEERARAAEDTSARLEAQTDPAPGEGAAWAADWGRLLRIARQVAGHSLAELALRTGLSKGYLSKLESGAASAANPSRATLAALARALPSFRPLAHTLEPGLGAEELAFEGWRTGEALASSPASAPAVPRTLIQLGWRELELLAALTVLDAAALPYPATAVVIARATSRDVASVATVLADLQRSGLVCEQPPAAPGAPPTYRCADDTAARVGVARLGDTLLLAAALLAGARHAEGGGH